MFAFYSIVYVFLFLLPCVAQFTMEKKLCGVEEKNMYSGFRPEFKFQLL